MKKATQLNMIVKVNKIHQDFLIFQKLPLDVDDMFASSLKISYSMIYPLQKEVKSD